MHPLKSTSPFASALHAFSQTKQQGFAGGVAPVIARALFREGSWQAPQLMLNEEAGLSPAACGVNYAQSIFEGMKAFKNAAGEINVFRPEAHYERMRTSASYLSMQLPSYISFLNAIADLCRVLQTIIPESSQGALYLRPLLVGTSEKFGLEPSEDFDFFVLAVPAGFYFAKTLSSCIERIKSRSHPFGTYAIKASANYVSNFQKREGSWSSTLWLDCLTKKRIEEFSAMNFFCVKGDTILTPRLTDCILPGITRDSVLKLSSFLNLKWAEEEIEIDWLLSQIEQGNIQEVFGSGTGAGIVGVSELIDAGKVYTPCGTGKITALLKENLVNIQSGNTAAFDSWRHSI